MRKSEDLPANVLWHMWETVRSEAREEKIYFDFPSGTDNDQQHHPELPRRDTVLLEVASFYLGTRNLIGKAMLFLKLCCLSSLP